MQIIYAIPGSWKTDSKDLSEKKKIFILSALSRHNNKAICTILIVENVAIPSF